MHARLTKRSLSLSGHRTSVALEPAFWGALEALAAERGQSLVAMVAVLDAGRQPAAPLASVLRLEVLQAARHGSIGLPGDISGQKLIDQNCLRP